MSKVFRGSSRTKFHMQPQNQFTLEMGYLYPIFFKECLPGDTWKFRVADATRLAPMLAPFYGHCQVSVMAFKEACRNLMDGFENFRTGGLNNNDTSVPPYMLFNATNTPPGSLNDMLGIPARQFLTPDANGVLQPNNQVIRATAWGQRMYTKVWNEWFRSEHIDNEQPLSTAAGYDTTTNMSLLRRHWNRDYFTNALPAQQLGPTVKLPLGTIAPVIGNGNLIGLNNGSNDGSLAINASGLLHASTTSPLNKAPGTSVSSGNLAGSDIGLGLAADKNKTGMVVDLSQATAATISQLRLAFKMQEVAEKLMRSGSRYVEWLASFWGVKGDDGRSEYIGGCSSDIVVTPVEQTSSTDATSPQGNLAGRGFQSMLSKTFSTTFTEDGFVMVLLCVRPKTLYAQGLPKQLQRWTRADYALPAFQHLSEEPLLGSELYCEGITNGTSASNWDDESLADNQAFGFKPIYQEYRSFPSEVHGEFLTTLNYWSMWREFNTRPVLNSTFMACNPTKRVFAAPSSTIMMANTMLDITLWRKLARHGTPRM